MMKVFSFLLSSLILVQSFNISFEDVSKLNVLLEHARYHQESYGDSFFEFISDHYLEEDNHSNNQHKEHEDLPFKHKNQTLNTLNFTITFNTFLNVEKSTTLKSSQTNFYYKESSSVFEKQSVFQPPKFS